MKNIAIRFDVRKIYLDNLFGLKRLEHRFQSYYRMRSEYVHRPMCGDFEILNAWREFSSDGSRTRILSKNQTPDLHA